MIFSNFSDSRATISGFSAYRFFVSLTSSSRLKIWPAGSAGLGARASVLFGLKPQSLFTVWLALNEVTRHNGCMRVIPGSQHDGTREHVETYDPDNLLSRGQALQDVDAAAAVDIVLRPGEFSIHHGHVFHSSEPNTSDDRRIGFALMMVPAHVESTIGRRSATLVSGKDRYGHWDHDPLPTQDRDPVIWQLMHDADQQYRNRRSQDAEAASAT